MKRNRDIALETVMIQEALDLLPKDHNWTSVRIWFENDTITGTANDGHTQITYIQKEWSSAIQ